MIDVRVDVIINDSYVIVVTSGCYMYVCVCECCVCMYIEYVHTLHIYTCIYTHILYLHLCIHAYTHMCTYVYIYIYICAEEFQRESLKVFRLIVSCVMCNAGRVYAKL